jgi:integrase
LRRLKREQAAALLALGVRQDGATLLCTRADGEPMQPRSLTHEFTRLIGRIKDLPRVRFHDLRHSHATQLLLAGGGETDARLYSHVGATMQEDAASKIDAALRRAKIGLEGA